MYKHLVVILSPEQHGLYGQSKIHSILKTMIRKEYSAKSSISLQQSILTSEYAPK